MEGYQVWDPVFLFGIDSSGARLDSDSLLEQHQRRWKWGAAVGGVYEVAGDTVRIQLRIALAQERSMRKQVLNAQGKLISLQSLNAQLLVDLVAMIDSAVDRASIKRLCRPATNDFAAYSTYIAGYGYEMRSRYAEAASAYLRAIELQPSFALALSRLGGLYARSGDYAPGRASLDKALAAAPKDPQIIASMGKFLLDRESPAKALKFISSQQAMLEQTVEGLTLIGRSYVFTGEYQRAIALLMRALAFGPVDLETEFILGNAYFSSGQFEPASGIYNRLVLFRPDYMRYYSSLGAAYRSWGRLMESAQILENALKIDPRNTTILINLAHTYFGLGWYEKAEDLLTQAQTINPEINEILLNLGVIYWHLGKKQEADMIFSREIHEQKNAQLALNNRANSLFLNGQLKKAITMYRRADRLGKKNETVLYNLASACLSAHRLKDALKYFEDLLQLSPARLDVLAKCAEIEVRRKSTGKAEIYYRTIIKLAPQNEGALIGLVEILKQEKQFEEAVDFMEKYLDAYPNNKRIRYLLARTYEIMAWYEVAVMRYEELINFYPNDGEAYLGLGRSLYSCIIYKNGREFDKAVYNLKTASDYLPGNPEPDYLAGQVYQAKNFGDLAIDSWKKALQKTQDKKMRQKIQSLIAGVPR